MKTGRPISSPRSSRSRAPRPSSKSSTAPIPMTYQRLSCSMSGLPSASTPTFPGVVDHARNEGRGRRYRGANSLPLRVVLSAPRRSRRWGSVYVRSQERQPVVDYEPLEVRVELARRDRLAREGGQGILTLLAFAWLLERYLDGLLVELDDVVRRRHRAAHPHARHRPGVHDPDPRDAPDVRDVAVSGEDHVDLDLPEDGHHVAGVAQVVHVAPRAGNREDVMVDDDYLRSPLPAPEFGVDPRVVLPPDVPLVEVGLGRVERHDLGLAIPHGHRCGSLTQAEEVLEVPIADVLGVVVAGDHDDVRAFQPVQVLLRRLELPPVTLHREVAGDCYEIRLQRVGLLERSLQKIQPEEPRSHVDVRHLHYLHLRLP